MHYEPVCGILEGGGARAYPNACGACAEFEVLRYQPGRCPEPDIKPN